MGASLSDLTTGKYTPQNNVIHHASNGCAVGLNCPVPNSGTGWYVDARSNKFVGIPDTIQAGAYNFTSLNGNPVPRMEYEDTTASKKLWTTVHNNTDTSYHNGFASGNTYGVYPLHIEGVPASFAYDPLRGFNTGGFKLRNVPGFPADQVTTNVGGVLTSRTLMDMAAGQTAYSNVNNCAIGISLPGTISTSTANTSVDNLEFGLQVVGDVTYLSADFDLVVTDKPSSTQSTEWGVTVENWYRQTSTTIDINLSSIIYALYTSGYISSGTMPFDFQAVSVFTEQGSIYNPMNSNSKLGTSSKPINHMYFTKCNGDVPDPNTVQDNESAVIGVRTDANTSTLGWCGYGFNNIGSAAEVQYYAQNTPGVLHLVIDSFKAVWLKYHPEQPTRKVLHFTLTFSHMTTRIPTYNLYRYLDMDETTDLSEKYYLLDPYNMMMRVHEGELINVPIYPAVYPASRDVDTTGVDNTVLLSNTLATKHDMFDNNYVNPHSADVDPDMLFNISARCSIGVGFKPTTETEDDDLDDSYKIAQLDSIPPKQYSFNPSELYADPDLVDLTDSLHESSASDIGAVLCPFNNNVYVQNEFRYDGFRMSLNMAVFGSWTLSGHTIGTSASLMRPSFDTLDTVSDVSDALCYNILDMPPVVSGNRVYHTLDFNNPTSTQRGAVLNAYMVIPNTVDMWQYTSNGAGPYKSDMYPYVFGMRSGQNETPDHRNNYHCVVQGDVWTANPRGGLNAVYSEDV